jgi:signal transduction histidine kinase
MRRGLLPVLLFLLAAGGTLFLGTRILASERVSAERTARERLRAQAHEAEAILIAASRLRREGLDETFSAVQGFYWEPMPFDRLTPEVDDDAEAAFYLAEGERAEAGLADLDRAGDLYRAATAEGRGLHSRLTAFFRLAALERRRGNVASARSFEQAFLGILPESRQRTLEALVVRARVSPPDEELPWHLILALDTPDETAALGLYRDAGPWRIDLVDTRREMLARMKRLRPAATAIVGLPPDAPKAGWGVLGSRVVSWENHYPTYYLFEEPLPLLPPGVRVAVPGEAPGIAEVIEESLESGEIPLRFRIVALVPRAVMEAEARRGAWMLGGALAALLLAGGAAFVISVRAARREAEAARARADFVTKMGHDLRTPLAVVRMYAETLAAGKVADPAEAREFASVAAREAERLTGIVGQVLDLSRIGEGDGALARRPLDLASLLDEVAAVHRPLLAHAGMSLDLDVAAPLPVLGDSAALRGAVSNLLENAGRHAASGGSVGIEAIREGRMAILRVLDRGPGLPAGMEESIFERFVRGPDVVGSGAGLGLALVREAAEAHGGAAAASNREGGGAVFEVRLPLAGEEGA